MAKESKLAGSEHESASKLAKDLCDRLYECLPEEYSPRRHFTDSTCGAYVKGRKASLYWLYHYDDHVRVYPYSRHVLNLSGELEKLLPFDVPLQTRRSLSSAWARTAPYYLEIRTPEQAQGMGPLLSYLADIQNNLSRAERSVKLDYWHSPSESEGATSTDAEEGNRTAILVNRYERSTKNRKACIETYGAFCCVCGFDFFRAYGEIGKDYIHVHHLTPLAVLEGKARKIDPIKDLRPVCPNCHEMLHQANPPYTPEQLRAIIAEVRK